MFEGLESDGVKVTLELILNHGNQSLYSYNISDVTITLAERTNLQLIASYNTLYNISILAIAQCGQRIVTTFIEQYYGKYIYYIVTQLYNINLFYH